jgi:malonate transporter and related proteins
VIAALPAAQNIYVIASRYDVGELLARDSIFTSTMLSVPTITLIAAPLGGRRPASRLTVPSPEACG